MSAFEERPPYGSYAQIMGTFASLLATAGALGRLLTWSLGAAAVNDFLQAGFAALSAKANEVKAS